MQFYLDCICLKLNNCPFYALINKAGTHIMGPVGTNKMCFWSNQGKYFHPFNIYLHLVYTPLCLPKTFHVIDACSLVYCKTFINFKVAEQSVHCRNTFTSKMLSLLCAVSIVKSVTKDWAPKSLTLEGKFEKKICGRVCWCNHILWNYLPFNWKDYIKGSLNAAT